VLIDGGDVTLSSGVESSTRHDVKMARESITRLPIERREPRLEKRQGRCLDKGYDDDEGVTRWPSSGVRPTSVPMGRRL
jgi:hypothetical protein